MDRMPALKEQERFRWGAIFPPSKEKLEHVSGGARAKRY